MLDRPHVERRRARQRAYRARQRDEIAVYPVPLPAEAVEVLMSWHWFDENADRSEIGRAIGREIAKSTKA